MAGGRLKRSASEEREYIAKRLAKRAADQRIRRAAPKKNVEPLQSNSKEHTNVTAQPVVPHPTPAPSSLSSTSLIPTQLPVPRQSVFAQFRSASTPSHTIAEIYNGSADERTGVTAQPVALLSTPTPLASPSTTPALKRVQAQTQEDATRNERPRKRQRSVIIVRSDQEESQTTAYDNNDLVSPSLHEDLLQIQDEFEIDEDGGTALNISEGYVSDNEDGLLRAVTQRLRPKPTNTTDGPALQTITGETEVIVEPEISEEDRRHALAPSVIPRDTSGRTGQLAQPSTSLVPTARAESSRPYSFATDDAPLLRSRSSSLLRELPLHTSNINDQYESEGNSRLVQASPYVEEQLLQSFRLDGCNCSRQTKSRTTSNQATGYTISGLVERWRITYSVPDILSIIALHRRIPTFPSHAVTSTNWQAILAGVEHSNDNPVSLSLERSDAVAAGKAVKISRTWDIDAIIIPVSSLGAHKRGVDIMFYPKFTKTITTSWHTPITSQSIIPRECKHLRFARGTGATEFDTYIFFPNLPLQPVKTDKATKTGPAVYRRRCYLTKREQREWIDEIFYPALLEIYADDIQQHMPRGFDEAADRSRARQRETISSADRSASELPYHLANYTGVGSANLHRLWGAILNRIPTDSSFAKPELVVITYNCKLQYRRPSFTRLRTLIERELDDRFDRSYLDLDHAFVDLAYEDMPKNDEETDDPYILLRRTTCNYADLDALGLKSGIQTFSWFGTADASSVVATPSKRSALRTGGLVYVQQYNVMKDMFVSPDRSTGPLFSDTALPFLSYTRQTFLDLQRIAQDSRSYSLTHVDRIRDTFKETVIRLHQVLETNMAKSNSFSTRQEYRISWPLFTSIEIPDRSPVLPATTQSNGGETGAHWPFYVLRKADVLEFVRWQLNRWLYAICTVISIPSGVEMAGQLATSLHQQQLYTATSSALFSCLQVIANSECVSTTSRIAHTTYWKPAELVSTKTTSVSELWSFKSPDSPGVLSIKDGDEVRAVPARKRQSKSALTDRETAGEPVFRRGLGLVDSLRKSNMVWLPIDMFIWERLCFDEGILVKTAFATPRFRALYQSKLSTDQDDCVRRIVDQSLTGLTADLFEPQHASNLTQEILDRLNIAGWTLWNVCIFGFSHEILRRLTHDRSDRLDSSKLPTFWCPEISDGERQGFYGLSYGLIHRATGHFPVISPVRGTGGRSAPGGFSDFPTTWEARISILFNFDDGFKRKNWENSRWRLWFRYCYDRLEIAAGPDYAQRWRKGFPAYAADKLTILPRYEADKLFQFEKVTSNQSLQLQAKRQASRSLKWMAAVPVFDPSTGPSESQQRPLRWQMIVQNGIRTTPNNLPRLLSTRPDLTNGQRLRYIDGLIGTTESDEDSNNIDNVITVDSD